MAYRDTRARNRRLVGPLLAAILLIGCASEEVVFDVTELTVVSSETRRSRAANVRDVAAQAGITNGPLLAGIAQVETGFAHCWSEATWACQGPYSESCNGPVIAGAADGPCSAEQGGLGMFQFDGGTFDQTLERDGEDILLEQGNIAHAVEFVLKRVIQEVPEATDALSAAQWMNSIPLEMDDPLFEEWGALIACRYNGCCSASCQNRVKYRQGALDLAEEFEPGFWDAEATSCGVVPAEGATVDDSDQCAYSGGNPAYWRLVDEGYGGTLQWTYTTDSADAANYALWQLDFDEAGIYTVEAHIAGDNAQSQLATYRIEHAAGTAEVVVDQSAADGWEALGDFEFAAGGSQSVRLDDNTGEPGETMTRLAFDAIRLTRANADSGEEDPELPSPGMPNGGDDDFDTDHGQLSGGCLAGGRSTGSSAILLVLIGLATLRRRRPSAP